MMIAFLHSRENADVFEALIHRTQARAVNTPEVSTARLAKKASFIHRKYDLSELAFNRER